MKMVSVGDSLYSFFFNFSSFPPPSLSLSLSKKVMHQNKKDLMRRKRRRRRVMMKKVIILKRNS